MLLQKHTSLTNDVLAIVRGVVRLLTLVVLVLLVMIIKSSF